MIDNLSILTDFEIIEVDIDKITKLSKVLCNISDYPKCYLNDRSQVKVLFGTFDNGLNTIVIKRSVYAAISFSYKDGDYVVRYISSLIHIKRRIRYLTNITAYIYGMDKLKEQIREVIC